MGKDELAREIVRYANTEIEAVPRPSDGTGSLQLRELAPLFVDQRFATTCSLACVAYALRALGGYPDVAETDLLPLLDEQQFRLLESGRGLGLGDMCGVAEASGLQVLRRHVDDHFDAALWHADLARTLHGLHAVIVVNFYYWDDAGTCHRSHFAPIAALREDAKQVKILAPRWREQDTWIDVDALLRSMHSRDTTADAYRGYAVLSCEE